MSTTETQRLLPAGLTLPIRWVGRQWAVTGYGLERIEGHRYEIPARRLGETREHPDGLFCGWHVHLAHKADINLEDFIAAYRAAARRWPRHVQAITPEVLARTEEEARSILARHEMLEPIEREVRARLYPDRPSRLSMIFSEDDLELVEREVMARARARYGRIPPVRFYS